VGGERTTAESTGCPVPADAADPMSYVCSSNLLANLSSFSHTSCNLGQHGQGCSFAPLLLCSPFSLSSCNADLVSDYFFSYLKHY
jgi:hypothetical protein